jgi:hypothetical protein
MNKNIIVCASIASLLIAGIAMPHSPEGCSSFTWDLAQEFAAFRSPALAVVTRSDTVEAYVLEPGKHYAATLHPQSDVSFAVPPERGRKSANPMAGAVTFRTGKPGRYRISLTSRHWVDVIDQGRLIASLGHEGRGGCELMQKVVEFDLPADRHLAIQLSGADATTVGIVITGPI